LPLGPGERRLLYAMTRNTAVPTIVRGGHRIKVIPSEVVVEVDGRILPAKNPKRSPPKSSDSWARTSRSN
jgi:hypothetical protein